MIQTERSLGTLVDRLRPADWIALDTEADSLHAYPEKLCLVQISFSGLDELVDPLAKIDLKPLWDVLQEHELILHGADYDLRLLRKNQNFVPSRIFDTMIASRLLGLSEFGLTHLIQQFLGLTLEKGSQKADWARRPLTERMESYARNDTRYLKPLADILRDQLREKGRLDWHKETCARLIVDCTERVDANRDESWRIKGSSRLTRPSLAVLRSLWLWREGEAIAANRPPFFILNHDVLTHIAFMAGSGHKWRLSVPRQLSPQRRRTLEAAVELALQEPPEQHPNHLESNSRRISGSEKRRLEELKSIRDRCAQELHLDPTLIASRATLGLLAHDWNRHAPELMRWQRDILSAGNA